MQLSIDHFTALIALFCSLAALYNALTKPAIKYTQLEERLQVLQNKTKSIDDTTIGQIPVLVSKVSDHELTLSRIVTLLEQTQKEIQELRDDIKNIQPKPKERKKCLKQTK